MTFWTMGAVVTCLSAGRARFGKTGGRQFTHDRGTDTNNSPICCEPAVYVPNAQNIPARDAGLDHPEPHRVRTVR